MGCLIRLSNESGSCNSNASFLTSTQIRLMVNPLEEEHRALLDAMEALIAMLRMALPGQDVQPDAEAAGRQIIAMSRAILRQEWQRVQRGA